MTSEKSFFLGRTDDFWLFAPHWYYLRRNLFGTSRITQNILTSFSFKKKVNDLIERDIFLCVYVEAQPLGILGGQDYSTFYNDVVCQKKRLNWKVGRRKWGDRDDVVVVDFFAYRWSPFSSMSFTVDSICKVDFYDVSKTISVKRGLRTSICLSEHVRNGHFFHST